MRSVVGVIGIAALLAGCMAGPRTPLERAAAAGDIAEVERLIRAGGSDLLGGLVWAARTDSVAIIRVLVRNGANPNGTAGVNNWTVLMHAIHKDRAAAVRALLEVGADPNGPAGGGTPLSMAAGYGDADVVRTLLGGGARPDAQALERAILGVSDIDNWTTGKCQADAVRLIVERDPRLVTPELLRKTSSKLNKCPDVRAALAWPAQRASGK
jgi:ankyrin repeat protein